MFILCPLDTDPALDPDPPYNNNTTSLESRQPLLVPVPDPGSESALQLVLWIRIRMVSELLPGSGIKVPDQNPAKSERAYK